MSEYLPHEVVVEILSRLPTKSLLRFRSVCKSWRSLIGDPSFISLHRRHSFLLLHCYEHRRSLSDFGNTDDHRLLFRSLSHDHRSLCNYSLPLPSINAICCHRHGLLCLSLDDKCFSLIICNPSLRRFLSLPKPSSYPVDDYTADFAFGFDSRTRDYKIVRIASIHDESYSHSAPVVEVYSLASRIWRTLPPGVAPLCGICHPGRNTPYSFVNGLVHWGAAMHMIGDGGYYFVLSFDFVDEVFHEIALPPCLSEEPVRVVGGGDDKPLTVYHYGPPCHASIWVMKEYGVVESWTKLFAFDFSHDFCLEAPSVGMKITGIPMRLPETLCVTDNGEILLLAKEGEPDVEKLYFVDVDKKRYRELQLGGEGQMWCYLPAGDYAESLVLLNNMDSLLPY